MNPWVLALGILSSSFFGSWHCAGMCGPVATLMANRKSLLSYHAGRLLGYVGLGTAGGALGQVFLNSEFVALRWLSAFLFAASLFLAGIQIFRGHAPTHLLGKLGLHRFFRLAQSGWLVGLLTCFLPCGWLFSYVAASIATQSPWAGGLVMFLFWLGGLPAITAMPKLIHLGITQSNQNQKRIAGGILITASLYTLVSFFLLH